MFKLQIFSSDNLMLKFNVGHYYVEKKRDYWKICDICSSLFQSINLSRKIEIIFSLVMSLPDIQIHDPFLIIQE